MLVTAIRRRLGGLVDWAYPPAFRGPPATVDPAWLAKTAAGLNRYRIARAMPAAELDNDLCVEAQRRAAAAASGADADGLTASFGDFPQIWWHARGSRTAAGLVVTALGDPLFSQWAAYRGVARLGVGRAEGGGSVHWAICLAGPPSAAAA